MSEKASYRINISPLQLMGFTIAMVVLIMGMVYATSSLILNGQKASAQTNQSNSASSPQYMLADDGAACVDRSAAAPSNNTGSATEQSQALGRKVYMNGKTYRIVGVVAGSQSNQDNDTTTTTTNTYSTDNRHSGNVDNRNSRNTDNRNSGNVDSKYSGNTLTDNRNSGNVDSRFSGNTVTTNLNSGNKTSVSTQTETTTIDNRNRDNTTTNTNINTTTSNNGNTNDSGNTNNQNNGKHFDNCR
jgi:hypothetical protein